MPFSSRGDFISACFILTNQHLGNDYAMRFIPCKSFAIAYGLLSGYVI